MQFFDKESEVRRKLSDREKAALERVEEDERVAMLQKKGRVIMAYGWPGAVSALIMRSLKMSCFPENGFL